MRNDPVPQEIGWGCSPGGLRTAIGMGLVSAGHFSLAPFQGKSLCEISGNFPDGLVHRSRKCPRLSVPCLQGPARLHRMADPETAAHGARCGIAQGNAHGHFKVGQRRILAPQCQGRSVYCNVGQRGGSEAPYRRAIIRDAAAIMIRSGTSGRGDRNAGTTCGACQLCGDRFGIRCSREAQTEFLGNFDWRLAVINSSLSFP